MSALLNHIVWTFGSLVIVICLLFACLPARQGFYYLVLITLGAFYASWLGLFDRVYILFSQYQIVSFLYCRCDCKDFPRTNGAPARPAGGEDKKYAKGNCGQKQKTRFTANLPTGRQGR